jgi:hypothetical protein
LRQTGGQVKSISEFTISHGLAVLNNLDVLWILDEVEIDLGLDQVRVHFETNYSQG